MEKRYRHVTIALLFMAVLLLNICLMDISPVRAQYDKHPWDLVPRDQTIWANGHWADPTYPSLPCEMDWGMRRDTYIMYEAMFGWDVGGLKPHIIKWLGQEDPVWVNSTCIKVTLRKQTVRIPAPGGGYMTVDAPYWVNITDWEAWLAGDTSVVRYYRPITAEDVKFSYYLLGAFDECPWDGAYWHMTGFRDRVGSMDNFVIDPVNDNVFYVRIKPEYANSLVVYRSIINGYLIVPADIWRVINDMHGIETQGHTIDATFANDWFDENFNDSWRIASGMYLPWKVEKVEWPRYIIMKKNPLWWGKYVFQREPAAEYYGELYYVDNPSTYPDMPLYRIDWTGVYAPEIWSGVYGEWHVYLWTYLNDQPYYLDTMNKIMIPNHRRWPLGEPWLHNAIMHTFSYTAFTGVTSNYLKKPSPLIIPKDDAAGREFLEFNATAQAIEQKYINMYYSDGTFEPNYDEGIAILKQFCYYINSTGQIDQDLIDWPNGDWYTKDGPSMSWVENYLDDNPDLTVGTVTHPASYWYEHGFDEADQLPDVSGVNVKLGEGPDGGWTLLDISGWTDINEITKLIASNVKDGLDISLTENIIEMGTYTSRMDDMDFDWVHYCMNAGTGANLYERYAQIYTGIPGAWSHYGDVRDPVMVEMLTWLDTPQLAPPPLTGDRQAIANAILDRFGNYTPVIPTCGHPDWYTYYTKFWVRWPNAGHKFQPMSPWAGSTFVAPTQFMLLSFGSSKPGAYADIDNNHLVELKDILAAKKAFGSYPCHSRWDFACDIYPIQGDGFIELKDILEIKKNFGKTW